MTRQTSPTLSVVLTGSGGAGVMTAGQTLLDAVTGSGLYGLMTRSTGPQIRGGEAAAMLRFGTEPVLCHGDRFDVLVAFDFENLQRFAAEIPMDASGLILADPAAGEPPEFLLKTGARIAHAPFAKLAKTVPGGRVSMVALGALAKLIGLPEEAIVGAVAKSVGKKKPEAIAASERGDAGRDFYALRATRDFERQGFGATVTRVERPFLDREATVAAIDHRWSPTDAWNVRTTLVGSAVDQSGERTRDTGGQIRIDHQIAPAWRQQLYLLHTGGALQLNDFGFLDRNDFNYARYELSRRITDLPADSPYASHNWRYAVSRRSNDGGVHIADAFAINRASERRDGGSQFFEIAGWTSGHDDLITRGHGVVRMPARLYAFAERLFPKKKHWSFYGNVNFDSQGLEGVRGGRWSVDLEPSYAVNDDLSVFAGLQLQRDADWLLWRGDNLLGTYASRQIFLSAGSVWLIGDRQELRVRLEALGLDAHARRAWRVAADGSRSCKHTRWVDQGVADRHCVATHNYQQNQSINQPPSTNNSHHGQIKTTPRLGQRKFAV